MSNTHFITMLPFFLFNLIPTILTTYIAWQAFISSEKAVEVGKLSLERPKLIINPGKNQENDVSEVELSNEGNVDAVNLQIFLKLKDKNIVLLERYAGMSISAGVEVIRLSLPETTPQNVGAEIPQYSILVLYENGLNQKQVYMEAFNTSFGSKTKEQLTDKEDGKIKYCEYLKIYKKLKYSDLETLKKAILSL